MIMLLWDLLFMASISASSHMWLSHVIFIYHTFFSGDPRVQNQTLVELPLTKQLADMNWAHPRGEGQLW